MLPYRPELDGLRAVAVLAVVAYHAKLGCPGGFMGVDVFFVLSGYLLTAILAQQIEAGTFSYLGFWQRRIRRLLPAFFLVLAATLAVGWLRLSPLHFLFLARGLLWCLLLNSNWFHCRELRWGYFSDLDPSPIVHTWSLSVEEQFYLLLPALLLLLFRLRPAARQRWLLALALMSWLASLALEPTHPSGVFFLLPFRAWELWLGSWLALRAPTACPPVLSGLAVVGLAAALGGHGNALLACLSTLPLLVPSTAAARWLRWPPLVWVGRRSYSLYLWHWPVVFYYGYPYGYLTWKAGLPLAVLSLLLAALSYRAVEEPMRRGPWLASPTRAFSFAVAGSLALGLVALAVRGAHGVPGRWSPASQRYFQGEHISRFEMHTGTEKLMSGAVPRLGVPQGRPQFLLWGDSRANVVAIALDGMAREAGISGLQVTYFGTPTAYLKKGSGGGGLRGESWLRWRDAVDALIRRESITHVLLAGAWDGYRFESETFGAALRESVGHLQRLGCEVWVLEDVPQSSYFLPRVLALRWPEIPDDLMSPRKFNVADVLVGMGTHPLDPQPLLRSSEGHFLGHVGGESLYRDGSHFTEAGALHLRPLFQPFFDRLKGSRSPDQNAGE